MSFFSKLGSLAKKVVGYVAPLTGLIPGVGGTIASGLAGAIGQKPAAAPPTVSGSAGGLASTLPVLYQQGTTGGVTGVPTPGGLMRSIGQGLGQLGAGAMAGISQQMGLPMGQRGARFKVGKLTGNSIPAGYIERMSPGGVIYLAKVRRGRGISSRDVRSFYRVSRLVSKIHGRSHARKRG